MKLRLIAVFLLMLLIFTGCNKIGEAPIEIQSSETESNATERDSNKKDDSSVNFTDTTDNKNNLNAQEIEDDGILKILTIGNSFSDDTMQYVYQIAKDVGYKEVKLGNLFIGGCSLDKHATNAKENKASYEYRINTAGCIVKYDS